MSHSKRFQEAIAKIDRAKTYTVDEAIQFVKQNPVKFDAGVELHFKLGIDPKKSEQTVRSTLVLPHGTGKTLRVAAFVGPNQEAEATAAGADLIGTQEVIDKIKETGKCAFDVAVATPEMMKKIGPIAKILGQQGLMPSPKTETVGPDVKKMVSELKGGKVAFRSDDGGNLHFLVGRVSFPDEKLKANIQAVLDVVRKAKPAESKGIFLLNVVLSSSMGPGIKISAE
jgi:large subunit ribosomal protein L1